LIGGSAIRKYEEVKEVKWTLKIILLKIEEGKTTLVDVFRQAMQAEKETFEFYTALIKKFESNPEIKGMIFYIAKQEMGHYELFRIELETAQKFEDFNVEFPMMHIGP